MTAPSEISPAPVPPPPIDPPSDISVPGTPAAGVSTASWPTSSNRSDPSVSSDAPERRKKIPNLAALAASVVRHRKPAHRVRYYSQVDMQSWAVRRSKFGKKRADFFAVLDGTDLTITKPGARTRDGGGSGGGARPLGSGGNGNSARRKKPGHHNKLVINVRTERVYVDVARRELVVHRDGRERPLRLQLINDDTCRRWGEALDAARTCDIKQFYNLGDLLGSGAYGQVYEAFDVRTNEKRAAKIVTRSSNLKSVEHLSREIEIMKSISHPGIVETYQIFDLKRKIYIVMECVTGGDLFDFVAKQEVLTETQGSETMRSIFEAVAYLHSRNIVHRDLKPENILCARDSWPLEIKVTDFGFSSILDEDSIENVMRTPVGTAYFMAPEIISNKGHGPPVDLWACGVILYTILTGRLPFPGRNRDEYFQNVLLGEPLFPSSLWKGISHHALNLVKGLLNTDPKKRLNALGAMNHNWISSAHEYAKGVEIKRNRANLHSTRRRLYKARSAVIAVAMAQKFKATGLLDLVEKFPIVVDKVGAGTKKAAQKTADKVMDGGDRIGDGTKKIAENVGEGSKKVVEGVKNGVEKGSRKVGEGVKKTANGIGTGTKKAAEGIGTGVKKTSENIANGAKKTKESIGTGVKKTGEGFKKAGEGIKKGAEKVKIDREKLEKLHIRPRFGGSQAESTSNQGSSGNRRKDRDIFRRRGRGRKNRSEGTRGVESDASTEIRAGNADDLSSVGEHEDVVNALKDLTMEKASVELSSVEAMRGDVASPTGQSSGTRTLETKIFSKTEFYSTQGEFVTPPPDSRCSENTAGMSADLVSASGDNLQRAPSGSQDIVKQTSEVSNESGTSVQAADEDGKTSSRGLNLSAGSGRPKLPPLLGLVGIHSPDVCDIVGDSAGSSDDMELLGEDDAAAGNKLRQAAAMLLATSDCSNPRTAFKGKKCDTLVGSHLPESSSAVSPVVQPANDR